MDTETVNKLVDVYAEVFKRASKKTQSDEAAAVIIDQIGKHIRIQEMRLGGNAWSENTRRGSDSDNGDVPATERQIAFLKQLGAEVPEGLTKRAASALIDETLAVENGNHNGVM